MRKNVLKKFKLNFESRKALKFFYFSYFYLSFKKTLFFHYQEALYLRIILCTQNPHLKSTVNTPLSLKKYNIALNINCGLSNAYVK